MLLRGYMARPLAGSDSSGRLRELDGWRAISVLLVIVHHIAGYQHHRIVGRFYHLDLFVHNCGYLGVKIFFVISGFVICRLLLAEEQKGSVSLRGFYCRRAFRILPPLYTYLAVLSLLLICGLVHESWESLLGAALLVHDIRLVPNRGWFVGHTWSLAVEEQFYLIFPTMLMITPKAWRTHVFIAVFGLCAVWNLSLAYTGWDALVSTSSRAGFACIACGVLMAIHETCLRGALRRLSGAIVILIALTLMAHPVGSNTWQSAVYESLFVPPAIGVVLLFSLERGALLRAVLLTKPVQAIGVTSYGIYLWQQFFTAPKIYFNGAGHIVPFLLPLLCVVVPLSYQVIERPLMRYGRALSVRKETIRAVTQPVFDR